MICRCLRELPILFLSLLFCFLAVSPAVSAETSFFGRNLGLGSSGPDVLSLQKILNSDPETRIALSGSGSPGWETSFFGALTKNAVMKFQKKYSSEILSDRQAPTGYVGPKTLRKLNELAGERRTSTLLPSPLPSTVPKAVQPSPRLSPVAPSQSPLLPKVSYASPNPFKVGDTVMVRGENFSSSDNAIFLRYGFLVETFKGLRSGDGSSLSFVFKPLSGVSEVSELEKVLAKEEWQVFVAALSESGLSLDDVKFPYRGVSSREKFDEALRDAGVSLADFNEPYELTVLNHLGRSEPVTVMIEREIRLGE